MGMTANHEDGILYWLLKKGQVTCLYRMAMFSLHDLGTATSEQLLATGSGESTADGAMRGKPEMIFEIHTKAL